MEAAEGGREKSITTSTTTNFYHAHCLLVRLYTYCVLTNTCITIIIVINNTVTMDKAMITFLIKDLTVETSRTRK